MDPLLAGLIVALIGAAGGFLGSFVGARVAAGSQERIAQKQIESQLRLAAIDRRLQVHQEAYTFWIRAMRALRKRDELATILPEAYDWWDRNCLYFSSPELATDFKRTMSEAGSYEAMLNAADRFLMEKIMNEMMETGPKLQRAVGLPLIGNPIIEDKELKGNNLNVK